MVSRLNDPIPVSVLPSGRFVVTQRLDYEIGRKGSGYLVSVPAGFVTDFASVPALLKPFFAQRHLVSSPSLIHDWLYGTHQTSKEIADAIFLEAMIGNDFPPRTARIMYRAVYNFGHRAYNDFSPSNMRRFCPSLYEEHFVIHD